MNDMFRLWFPITLLRDLRLTRFGHSIHTARVCFLPSTFPQKTSTFDSMCPSTPRRKFTTSNQSWLARNASFYDWRVPLQGDLQLRAFVLIGEGWRREIRSYNSTAVWSMISASNSHPGGGSLCNSGRRSSSIDFSISHPAV